VEVDLALRGPGLEVRGDIADRKSHVILLQGLLIVFIDAFVAPPRRTTSSQIVAAYDVSFDKRRAFALPRPVLSNA
jgi:hypothetical protein